MTDRLIEDVVGAVMGDACVARCVRDLPDADRAAVEASVRALAELMEPFLRASAALSGDAEALARARVELAEKLRAL